MVSVLVVLRSTIEVLEMSTVTVLHLISQALSSRAWITTEEVGAFVLFFDTIHIGRVVSRKAGG